MLSVDKTKPVSTTPATSTASTATTANSSRFAETLRSVQHRGRDLDPIFAKASATYGVPKELLRAIAFHESGFQTDAVSHAGAMGLMQLMPVAAQSMGVSNPFDPEQNVMGGAKLLGQYLEKYDGNLKLTLAAYGAGCGSVAKYNGIPPYKETQAFVADIMSVVHAGGLPAWDHTGAPTATLAGVQASTSVTPAAKAVSPSFAVKTTVTPAATSVTATTAKTAVTADTGKSATASVASIAAAHLPESVVADAPVKTTTSPLSQSVTLPKATTTAASATAVQILTTVTPASAVISAGLGITTPTSAVITAAEIAAQNLAELLAANASKKDSQTPDPATLPAESSAAAPSSGDAFRTALVRGLSNIGTGNMSSMQTVFFAEQPSSAAIAELFKQIEAFDDFTEADYRLLVESMLADTDKLPSEDDGSQPFYLNM